LVNIHGIICYWEYGPANQTWFLVESFPINDDGYCMTKPSTGGGDREEWLKWMNSKVYYKDGKWVDADQMNMDMDDYEYDDWKPIMGRAVTIWTMQHGTALLDIHPPEFPRWLSASFYEELRKLPNWASLLEKGYDLYFGTTNEVEKYINFKEK